MNIDSIMFDLDGTLWDVTETTVKAWNDTIGKMKEVREPITKEQIDSVMGLRIHEIGERLFPYFNKDKQLEVVTKCCNNQCEWILKEGGVLYPSLEETLKTLSEKLPIFIVSNCEKGYIEAFFGYHGLGKYFTGYECAGNTGCSKGENIKIVADRFKLKSPVYVGDTQGDCDAAEIAGVPFVYASYGFGEVKKYYYKLEAISDVTRLVK